MSSFYYSSARGSRWAHNLRCSPGVPFLHRSERGRLKVLLERMPLEGLCTRQLWTLPYRQKIETSLSLSWSLSLSTQAQKTKELVLAGPVGPVLLQGGKSSVHTACKAHSREYTSPQARLGPWARKLSTPTQSSTVSEVVEVVRLWSDQHVTWDWILSLIHISEPTRPY